MATLNNRQFKLIARPVGMPKRADFDFTTEPVGEPRDGEVLVKVQYISLDPAMRGWMNEGKSYIPPVKLGEVMRAGSAGKVLASKNAAFAAGDYVTGWTGVQEYSLSDGNGLTKVDPRLAPLPVYLGTLGMPGMTAYFGLLEVGKPQPGDTVVVSGAAGAVGTIVGQIAKIKGCRAVGIAGGKAKCDYVSNDLGFDAVVDYKAGNLEADLRAALPKGADVYFENVGGAILDAMLARMRLFSRIVVCGLIAEYDAAEPYGYKRLRSILVNRIRMQGMIVFDWKDRYGDAIKGLASHLASGRLKYRESVIEGLENAPRGLIGLLKGENFGKQLVRF
jgi:hypothetical protein